MKLASGTNFRIRIQYQASVIAALLVCLLLQAHPAIAEPNDGLVIQQVTRNATDVQIHFAQGVLRIEPCTANIARITYAPGNTIPTLSNPYMPHANCVPVSFQLQQLPKAIVIKMPQLTVSVRRESGAVYFSTPDGKELLHESDFPLPRQMKTVNTDGLSTYRASVWFALTPQEHLYGLGQHQSGLLNQRGLGLILSQDNTNISIPMFLSSKGYGIFWNNPGVTRWTNRFLPVLWISSNVSRAIDYFFINGPSFDKIVSGYRCLTGNVPLFPRWAYGFWQSKDRYASQQELLGVAKKYRQMEIPIDNIVLDEGWETVLGSRVFNSSFPDPSEMVKALHDEHMHLMVSIWPIFQPGSTNYKQMLHGHLFIGKGVNDVPPDVPGSRLYDPFSEQGREVYWQQVKKSLYDIGVDGYWLDSTEPLEAYGEEHGPWLAGAHTAMGNGSQYADLYPFMTTKAIYDGQRATTSQKRVFMLTRSAFAGMQHNAAAAWSGDVATNFDALRREIPAGLNYSMTGLPYWTTDIGGFVGGDTTNPAYQQLFIRWFQYGTFCPIFRVHGSRTNNENELWSYGTKAQKILTLYDRLRYRLLPYIYTLAARTTFDNYTPMRALPFDFRTDPKVLSITNEFMFGPAFLVAPVTHADATSRSVYLPRGAEWYDFWTGKLMQGGQVVTRATPLNIMPLYVRSGSIVPMGPEEQYSNEYPGRPIELRIYPGKNANFSLYEDDGTTYDYENGQYTWIGIHWDDKTHVLTLDARRGRFSGMPKSRKFAVVLVSKGHGTGEAMTGQTRIVDYDGLTEHFHL